MNPEPMNEPKEQLSLRQRIAREALSWLWIIAAFLLINGTLGQARVIPSGSMERTLLVGDHLLMSRFGYDAGIPFTDWRVPLWRSPHRQQIVVFQPPPPLAPSPDYIKRVIGVPGDTLEIRGGAVWINGKPLDEPYLNAPMDPGEHFGPVVVPAGHYFMMGDNRSDSYDSRFWGFVPRSAIIGAPVMIYMSVNAPDPQTWEPGHIGERFYTYLEALLHPHLVRWHRLFRTF